MRPRLPTPRFPPPAEGADFQWHPLFQSIALVDRDDGRRLVLAVASPFFGPAQVMAFEMAQTDSIDNFFADHAHKMVGTFPDDEKAKAGAAVFARDWLRTSHASPPCACDEIGRSTKAPAPARGRAATTRRTPKAEVKAGRRAEAT